MSVNAPVQDLLIRIKNAYMARRVTVEWVIYSSFKESVLELLKKYKFISTYSVVKEGNHSFFTVQLKTVKNPITDIPVVKFFSKPSRRWYISYKDIKPVAAWKGIGIISTSKWLLPTHEARKLKVWWELIAEIY